MIPVIETEWLILRAQRMSDFEPYAAHMGSDRARYEDGPKNQKEAWFDFAGSQGHWLLLGFGCWAIERREDGTFCGLTGINRHVHYPEHELGWSLLEHAEGQGIAFEAAVAARDYAREHQGIGELVSYIDPDNTRSIKLAERLGAVLDPQAATPENEPCLVYRHPNQTGAK